MNKKRKDFEAAEWAVGADSLPQNPRADKNCKECKGHGIVDNDIYLENCSKCWCENPPITEVS